MKLEKARVLVTGATGGIGSALVRELLDRGASVLATGRDARALERLANAESGGRVQTVTADLCEASGRERVGQAAARAFGGIDVLVNNAGVGRFELFDATTDADIERLLQINVIAPMQLTRTLLPILRSRAAAAIVNVGSVLGAIGLPGQVAYSASKFALRGYSEALRRELAGSGVRVLHVAPRATRTGMNSDAVDRLNLALGNASDAPGRVAAAICAALERDRARTVLGWPERAFVKLNSILPALVDRALAAQLDTIRAHAPSTSLIESSLEITS